MDHFGNALQSGGIWKRRLLFFRVDGKHFDKKELFQSVGVTIISLTEFFLKYKSNGKLFMRFQREPSIFKFLWCSVDRVVIDSYVAFR